MGRLGRPIAILGDLQGPKIRIGVSKKSYIILKNNQRFVLDLNPKEGDQNRVFLPLTEKDVRDLKFCLDLSLDYIALSFVQKAKDINDLKKYVGKQTGIMAKFEKPMAIKNMDEILQHCDAAMVARGDLGVEMPPEEVPIIQKKNSTIM